MILGALAVLFLAAAFSAGRLLKSNLEEHGSQGKELVLSDDGQQAMGLGVRLEPDESLPDQPPAASGQFDHRQDNRIFIRQFPMTSGVVYLDSMHEWPVVEVVLTKETRVYKDVTDLSGSYGGGVVQQEVAPGSIDDIGEHGTLVVWGELRGERIVAEVIQYFSN